MTSHQADTRNRVIRKPVATVLRQFGTPCPAGYRVGERIPIHFAADGAVPEGTFRCSGTIEALGPFIDVMEERLDHTTYPVCELIASCDCPLAHSEVVFSLTSMPTRV